MSHVFTKARRARCLIGQALILCALVPLFAACSLLSGTATISDRVLNQGPVNIDAGNPFLVGNLALRFERSRSPELDGFIQHRGLPSGIEIESFFLKRKLLHLYYLDRMQRYVGEDAGVTWVVRGPLPMDSTLIAKLEKMRASNAERVEDVPHAPAGPTPEPTILTPEARSDADKLADVPPPAVTPAIAREPIVPPPTIAVPQARTPRSEKAESSVPDIPDAELLRRAESSPAELSPIGDLVHYVTYEGETLSMLARWYTFDRANAVRIARINQLDRPDRLEIGDTIVIPAYMVKNSGRLSEEAVKALTQPIARPTILSTPDL